MAIRKVLLCVLLSISSVAVAQTDTLLGRISNDKGEPIRNATISIGNRVLAISDINGSFTITNFPQQNEVLSIRSLGYESLDTLIGNQRKSVLQIVMTEKIYEQEGVEITAEQNLFTQSNWNLLDYVIYEDKIALLYIDGKERKLGIFEFDGTLNNYLKLDEKYDEVKISCTNTLLLISNRSCTEYVKQFNQLTFLEKYSVDLYKKALSTCIAKIDEELIFKRHLDFNKRIYYTKYNRPEEEIALYEVIDWGGLHEARSRYSEIIGEYTLAIKGLVKDPHQVNSNLHIIEEGLWDGNLLKLAITRELMRKISYFLNFHIKAVNAQEFAYNDSIFIMDFVNKEFVQLDIDSGKTKTYELQDFDWKEKYRLMQDKANSQLYLLSKTDVLQQINKTADSISLQNKQLIDFGNTVHRNVLIYKQNLYHISHDYNGRTKFHKVKLLSPE